MAGKTEAMVGEKFGMLTVVSVAESTKNPCGSWVRWLNCVCDCGREVKVSYGHLKNGQKSCGCIAHRQRFEDLTGKKFGKLTVIRHIGRVAVGTNGQYSQLWECMCECGNRCNVNSRSLKSYNTKSCGCINGELLRQNHLNRYDLSGEYGIGYCKNGGEFYFDIEDFPVVKKYTWHLNDNGYVITTYKFQHIRMHRLLCNMSEDDELTVDHINHVTYDNRKSNLRICTKQQNGFNKTTPSNNISGHVGVKQYGDKYRAYIGKDGKTITLGTYASFEDAVTARERAERIYFKEFAIERTDYDRRKPEFSSETCKHPLNV